MSDIKCYVLKWRSDGEYITRMVKRSAQYDWGVDQRRAVRFTKSEAFATRGLWGDSARVVRLIMPLLCVKTDKGYVSVLGQNGDDVIFRLDAPVGERFTTNYRKFAAAVVEIARCNGLTAEIEKVTK